MADNQEPRFYILGRLDLKTMNPGKLAAQSAHAQRMADHQILEKETWGPDVKAAYLRWSATTNQGYGTTITLGAPAAFPLWALGKRGGPPSGVVVDPSYPQGTPNRTIDWTVPVTLQGSMLFAHLAGAPGLATIGLGLAAVVAWAALTAKQANEADEVRARPVVVAPTCAWLFGTRSEVAPYLYGLDLHP